MTGFVTYEYDSLGNLIAAWDSAGRREAFSYDLADNRTQNVVSSGAAPPPPAAQAMIQSADAGGMVLTAPSDDPAVDNLP